jgi:arylsulfatase A-like enzyme
VLEGEKLPRRSKPLFWKYPSRWPPTKSRPDHWVTWAVVHDKWKLVANNDLSHVELYRIASDVAEATDVSEAQPDTVRELPATLKSWQAGLPENPVGSVFSSERN